MGDEVLDLIEGRDRTRHEDYAEVAIIAVLVIFVTNQLPSSIKARDSKRRILSLKGPSMVMSVVMRARRRTGMQASPMLPASALPCMPQCCDPGRL